MNITIIFVLVVITIHLCMSYFDFLEDEANYTKQFKYLK